MPIDPSIIAGLKVPQFADPLESFVKAQSARNMLAQGQAQQQNLQINQERLQAEQLANQKAQLAAKDSEIIRGAAIKANGDPEKTIQFAREGGAGPEAVQGLQTHYTNEAKSLAEIEDKKLPVTKFKNDQLLGLHDTALTVAQKGPEALAQAWPQIYAQAVAIDPETAKHFSPDHPPTPDQIATSKALHQTRSQQITEEEQKRATSKATEEAAAAKRAADEAAPKLTELQAKAEVATRQNAATELATATNAEQYGQMLDAMPHGIASKFPSADKFDPKTTPQAVRQLGMTPEQQAQTVETAKQHDITNTNEQSRIQIQRDREKREKAIYQQTYGEGSNEALRTVEPKLRTAATSAAQKAAGEYQTAQKAADDIQSIITLVKSGNKAAGSNLPLVGVEAINALQGIKRINRTEVEQYEGAGSLLDNLKGKVGKVVNGQPIPADVLKDIEQMHSILRGNSEKAYADKLSGINQNYHANFKSVTPAAPASGNGLPKGDRKPLSEIFK